MRRNVRRTPSARPSLGRLVPALRATVAGLAVVLGACGDREPEGGRGGGPAGGAAGVRAGAPGTMDPADAVRLVALQNRGIGLLERFDYGEAVKPLRESVALAPTWVPGRVHLAIALIHQGPDSRPEAREILAQILREVPDHPHAAFLAAWLAENNGDTEPAIAMYRHAYEVTGRDPVVGARLGIMLAGMEGKEEEALAILTDVHARRPALVSPVNQIMLLHRQLGRDAESESYLARLRALKGRVNPSIEAARVGQELRDAYGGMGPYSAAIRDFAPPATAGATDPTASAAVTATVSDLGPALGAAVPGAPHLGAAVFDFDRDGDLDAFVCGGAGPSRLLRNDGGTLTDVAAAAGAAVAGVYAVAAGDVDIEPAKADATLPPGRRARVDLVLLRADGLTLLRNGGDGTFEDVTAASGLAADPGGARAAILWDADQDGDLDLFLSGADGATNRLWANGGPGRFTNVTADTGLAGDGGAHGPAAVVDFDNDYDLDLVVARPDAPPAVFRNERLLKFTPVVAPTGAGAAVHGLVAGDFDADGNEDVVLFGDATSTLLAGTGDGFSARALVGAPGGPAADVDPRLAGGRDLLYADGTLLDAGLLVGALRGDAARAGQGAARSLAEGAGAANLVAADFDGDGVEEVLLVEAGKPVRRMGLRPERRGNALVLDLEGVIRNDVQAGWSNLEGRGAMVEVKAGTLWQRRRAGNPQGHGSPLGNRLLFGVGRAKQADFVRIVWPDAVQHAVLDVPAGAPQPIVEEQRRPDSCPLLFSWDGERWAFVTDFLGVGGIGFLIAPGVYGPPDPTETVKVEAPLVRARDGKIVFKIHEAMEEVCYVDHADLEVVDHPADVTVFPDERFAGEPPFPDGRTLAYRREILPVAARDGAGADVTERVAAIDRRYPDSFRLHPRLLGATDEAVLELDFGDRLAGVAPGDPIALFAHGWIEYGYTRTSVAAAGEGFVYQTPALDVFDASSGRWTRVVANLGYPAGFPRVMTYDLTGVVSRDTPRLRIRTNFEVYWDRVWLAPTVPAADLGKTVRRTIVPAESADLRWVGYPREYSPDGRVPRIYDYHTMDPSMPWKTVEGDYTRFGDVTPLLAKADDMYVVFGKGEEIEVRWSEAALPPLPAGWTRSWFLRFTGWCKGQELYTAHGWTVEPLPFLGMSHYPYRPDERYPDTPEHRRYRAEWNTRRVRAATSDVR